MFAGRAGADETVDQEKAVAFECRVAALPCVREQQRGSAPIRAALGACAGQRERRKKILQQVAPALKAVKDVERGEWRAGCGETVLIEIDEVLGADVDVAKQHAQVSVDGRRAMQAVQRFLGFERILDGSGGSLRSSRFQRREQFPQEHGVARALQFNGRSTYFAYAVRASNRL